MRLLCTGHWLHDSQFLNIAILVNTPNQLPSIRPPFGRFALLIPIMTISDLGCRVGFSTISRRHKLTLFVDIQMLLPFFLFTLHTKRLLNALREVLRHSEWDSVGGCRRAQRWRSYCESSIGN